MTRAVRLTAVDRALPTVAAVLAALSIAAPRARVFGQAAPTSSSATTAAAATTAPNAAVDEATVLAVARGLNCPICQGRNLVECPLPVCAEMRAEIRTRLEAGDDPQAVIQHFVDYYGPAVRNTPPLSGPLALAWWVPLAMLVAGGWLVGRLVTSHARAPLVGAGAAAPDGDAAEFAAALEQMAAARDVDAPR